MSLASTFQKTKTEVLDCVFPKRCVGCASLNSWLCFNCFSKIIHEPQVRRKIHNFSVYACANYKNKIIQNLINYLKYNGVTDLAADGAKLLATLYSAAITDEADLITWIPLHPKRQAERTFNQAELLSTLLARELQIDYSDLLFRNRHSESQTHLSDEERKKNMANIFQINLDNKQKIVGRTILLVDDVVTSCATISEAAKILKRAGAYKVIGLCLASR